MLIIKYNNISHFTEFLLIIHHLTTENVNLSFLITIIFFSIKIYFEFTFCKLPITFLCKLIISKNKFYTDYNDSDQIKKGTKLIVPSKGDILMALNLYK